MDNKDFENDIKKDDNESILEKSELVEKNEEEKAKDLFDRIPEDVMDEFSDELQEPKMGVFKRMIELFINPSDVMEDVKIKPYIWIMFVIFAVVGLLTLLPTLGLLKEAIIDATLAQNAQITDTGAIEMVTNIGVITGVIGVVLGMVLGPVVRGVVSHVVALLLGGVGKLKQVIGVSVMSYTAVVLGLIVRLPLVLITNNYYASFSLGMFAGKNPTMNPYYGLLAMVDIFTILSLYFYYIGIKKVHEVSTGKAIVIAIIPTLLSSVFAVLPLLLMK